MEEEFDELQKTLSSTNAQLEEIRNLIADSNTAESDVIQLRAVESDLVELMLLTEGQMLDAKKSQLLAQLDEKYQTEPQSAPVDPTESLEEFLTQLDGLKCSAPYKTHLDAQVEIHNCVIFDVDTDNITDVSTLKVKVLFTQPIVDKMRPCGYFLDEKCRFSSESCKFSHGYEVEFGQLQEYNEPEFSDLSENCSCLALGSDELWHLAQVESICRGEMRLSAKFLTTGRQVALEFCQIFPLATAPPGDSESTAVENDQMVDDNNTVGTSETSVAKQKPIGQWENHTRAIGSKLMAKMGFEPGKGLGRFNHGRVDPIESRILPKGKSLDFVMENVKKSSDPLSKGQKRRAAQKLRKIADGYKPAVKPPVDGIFDFLNSKLTGNANSNPTASHSQTAANSKVLKSTTAKDLNVKVLKLSEQLKTAEKSRDQLVKSLGRAEAHNSAPQRVLANQIRHKIGQIDGQINRIRSELNHIDREQITRKDQQKISHF